MNEDALDEAAAAALAMQFLQSLRDERAAQPGRSVLFPRLGDASLRRQVVRWIGHEYRQATPGILETLRSALRDTDWEVRASAMLVAARLRATPLRSAVRDVALPGPDRHGLDEHDARLLVACRVIATEALGIEPGADLPAELQRRLPDAPATLLQPLFDAAATPRDATGLWLHALTLPTALEDARPEPLPPGIVLDERQLLLGGVLPMVRVSALPHWLGGDDAVAAASIRRFTPTSGFFIARRPLSAADLDGLGAALPATLPAADPATAACLEQTVDAPLLMSHESAVALCAAIARLTGTPLTLPSADELECAARGTDGRRYSWGMGLQRLNGRERSPHGLERFAVPAAQWTSTMDSDIRALVLGGPRSPRCSARVAGVGGHALRPLIAHGG